MQRTNNVTNTADQQQHLTAVITLRCCYCYSWCHSDKTMLQTQLINNNTSRLSSRCAAATATAGATVTNNVTNTADQQQHLTTVITLRCCYCYSWCHGDVIIQKTMGIWCKLLTVLKLTVTVVTASISEGSQHQHTRCEVYEALVIGYTWLTYKSQHKISVVLSQCHWPFSVHTRYLTEFYSTHK